MTLNKLNETVETGSLAKATATNIAASKIALSPRKL